MSMDVTIGRTRYRVSWEHKQRGTGRLWTHSGAVYHELIYCPSAEIKGYTLCRIFRVVKKNLRQGLLRPEILASGTSFCSIKDVFNKTTGRKISLTRALERLFPSFQENMEQL